MSKTYLLIDADKETINLDATAKEVIFMDDKRKVLCSLVDFGNGIRISNYPRPGKTLTIDYSQLAYLIDAFFILKAEGNNLYGSHIFKVQKELIKEI